MLLLNKTCRVENIDDVLVLDGGLFCCFSNSVGQSCSAYFHQIEDINEEKMLCLGVNSETSVKAIGPNTYLTALKVIAHGIGFKINKDKSYEDRQKTIRFNSENNLLQIIAEAETNHESRVVNVMTIDDSKVIHLAMKKILEGSDSINVVSQVLNPLDVERELKNHKVDFITLDLHMPNMNGKELYKNIIKPLGIPTMVLSSLNDQSTEDIFDILDLGVCDFFEKPSFDNIIDVGNNMREKILTLSESKAFQAKKQHVENFTDLNSNDVLVIGASTGGTKAIEFLLNHFEGDIPSIVIAQHIPEVFSLEYAKRLNSILPFDVIHIQDDMEFEKGKVYVCPGDHNTMIVNDKNCFKFKIMDNCDTIFSPSIDVFFESCLSLTDKLNFLPIILTGMGADGASSIKKLKDKGLFTIGQSEKSCVVYGMSKRAKEFGGISIELDLEEIPQHISQYFNGYKNKKVS